MVSVNVAQLLQSATGAVREYDFAEPIADPDQYLRLRGPVSGHVKLMRTSRGILAHSDYEADVTVECSRCLEEAVAHVESSLDEEFMPDVDLRTGLPVEGADLAEQEDLLIGEDHEIHLDELLRQNLLTSLPFQPLCDAACAGLCPTCGERLGEEHGTHGEPVAEPSPTTNNPFAKLAVLLRDDEAADEPDDSHRTPRS